MKEAQSIFIKKCLMISGHRDLQGPPGIGHVYPVILKLDSANPELACSNVTLVQTNESSTFDVDVDTLHAFMDDPAPAVFCEVITGRNVFFFGVWLF